MSGYDYCRYHMKSVSVLKYMQIHEDHIYVHVLFFTKTVNFLLFWNFKYSILLCSPDIAVQYKQVQFAQEFQQKQLQLFFKVYLPEDWLQLERQRQSNAWGLLSTVKANEYRLETRCLTIKLMGFSILGSKHCSSVMYLIWMSIKFFLHFPSFGLQSILYKCVLVTWIHDAHRGLLIKCNGWAWFPTLGFFKQL